MSNYTKAVDYAHKFRNLGFAAEVWGIHGDDRIAYVVVPQLPSTFRFAQDGQVRDVTDLNLDITKRYQKFCA